MQELVETKTPHGLFDTTAKIQEGAENLHEMLSNCNSFIVGYKPYPEQVASYSNIFGAQNLLAKDILECYSQKFDINTSNNYGITLLHNLIWFERFDLAKLVIENPQFNKINFKFCIPAGMNNMYSSALDIAILMYITKKTDLAFISTLLEYGAFPPVPGKKFLNSELVEVLFPIIATNIPEASISEVSTSEELSHLLCLLARYGLSLDKLEQNFEKRLFTDKTCITFEQTYEVSVENQRNLLDGFLKTTKSLLENSNQEKLMRVEMTAERADNGDTTLNLPLDTSNPPCSVM